MDKDAVLKVVGELYLENEFLRKQVEQLTEEVGKLRVLAEELQRLNTG